MHHRVVRAFFASHGMLRGILSIVLAGSVTLVLAPVLVHGHGEPLDDYGCHASGKGRTYHCHQGLFAGQSFTSRTEMLSARMDSYTGLPPEVAATERFSGQVVSVTSGDQITILHSGQQRKVRLNDVACPRKGQPYATQSKRFTWFMVSNRDVIVTVVGRDADGQLRGAVTLPDGRILSREIIKEGICWWNRKQSTDHSLEDLEAISRAEKRGLWADPYLLPPWERASP
jgi:endonuclease YncB( thermonuclease family)